VLLEPQTWPFTVATVLLLLIAILEGLALLLGASVSEWLHGMVDHPDAPDAPDAALDRALGWLHVGRVPLLVLLVLFLASFALTGFALNMVVKRIFGLWLTPWVSVPLAFVATVSIVRSLGNVLARIVPREQSFAVTFDSLIGLVATVVNGTARQGYPAQAKVVSQHGQTLYVMVEPDEAGVTFQNGSSVLLVRQLAGNRFTGIDNPRPDLL
jgi:Protein of unknown function (DUF1449)